MRLAQGLYVLAALINLYSSIADDSTINEFTKPLLMPILIWLIFLQSKAHVTLPRMLLAISLVFAWIGDLMLLINGPEWYFLAGLGSFLIMQIIYCIIFRKCSWQTPKMTTKLGLPIGILIVLVLVLIIPNAAELKLPVAIYSLCITTMLTFALLRHKLTTASSFQMVVAGALLFVVSDALIGINKFIVTLPLAQFWIMLTYIPAQFLIVHGIMEHE